MNKSSSSILRLAVVCGCIILVIGGIRVAANIVNIVLLAYVVVLLTTPIIRWLTQWRVPLFVAVFSVFVLIVGLLFMVGMFIFLSLRQIEAGLPQYQAQLSATAVALQKWLISLGIDLSQLPIGNSIPLSSLLQPVLSAAGKMVSSLTNVLVNTGLMLVIVFFALFEVKDVSARLSHAFAGSKKALESLVAVNDGVRKYIVLKAVTGAVMATADTILLLVVGVEFALLWGLLAFLMNFIPNIGFIIALIPPVLIAFLQYGLGAALIVLIGYLLINILVNTLLSPRIMGQGLNLSATIIFIALLFWSWVLGGIGVFMAVPLLIMMKVLAQQFDDTKWLATAVSGEIGQRP